jgi:hypothetical protein
MYITWRWITMSMALIIAVSALLLGTILTAAYNEDQTRGL